MPQGAGPSAPAERRRRRSTRSGPETDQLLASVIRSKVEAPPVRDQTLARPRLLSWLSDHLGDRVKLIVAEAGYGKTTLLADFARRDVVRCLWYKLETSDRDWVTFINYLIAAGRQAFPGFAPSTASLLREMAAMNPSRDVVLGSLISELPALGDAPIMIILDDFQLVDDSEDVEVILSRLFERAPPLAVGSGEMAVDSHASPRGAPNSASVVGAPETRAPVGGQGVADQEKAP